MEFLLKFTGIISFAFLVDIAMLPFGKMLMDRKELSIFMLLARMTPTIVAVLLTIVAF